MVCYSRRLLPTGRGPYRTTRVDTGSPHIVCSSITRTCENGGPPPLPFWGGSRAWGCSRVRAPWPVVPCLVRQSRTGMGGEEECTRMGDSNPGCKYLVAPLCIFSGEVTCPIILLHFLFGGAERSARACWPDRNIGPQQSGKSGLPKSKMTEYWALRVNAFNADLYRQLSIKIKGSDVLRNENEDLKRKLASVQREKKITGSETEKPERTKYPDQRY